MSEEAFGIKDMLKKIAHIIRDFEFFKMSRVDGLSFRYKPDLLQRHDFVFLIYFEPIKPRLS